MRTVQLFIPNPWFSLELPPTPPTPEQAREPGAITADEWERRRLEKLEELATDGPARWRGVGRAKRDYVPTNAKPVRCVELDKVFPSGAHAARELGISQTSVSRSVRKGIRLRGYRFEEAA